METPQWLLDRCRMERPTEIFVPLVEGIGPVWSHHEKRGGWFAYIAATVHFEDADGTVAECDHIHVDEAEAWACAASLGRAIAQKVMR